MFRSVPVPIHVLYRYQGTFCPVTQVRVVGAVVVNVDQVVSVAAGRSIAFACAYGLRRCFLGIQCVKGDQLCFLFSNL